MKVESKSILDLLSESTGCLGACFCSYTFDAELFENQVLASVLGVESDPVEMTSRFLDEVYVQCREVPIICIVSGQHYRGGKRLPYGLATVTSRTFHPKIYWLLFEEECLVAVGSGNLTHGGFGLNSELFLSMRLSYENAHDRAIISGLKELIAKSITMFDRPEDRAADFINLLHGLCPNLEQNKMSPTVRFLHTEKATSLLSQILKVVGNAGIHKVGIMAPFFEEDGSYLEGSVLGTIVKMSGKSSAAEPVLELVVPWDENSLDRPGARRVELRKNLKRLWCWLGSTVDNEPLLDYWVPTGISGKRVIFEDAHGRKDKWDTQELMKDIAENSTWPCDDITLFAPRSLIETIEKQGIKTRISLFPARHIEDGRLVNRPLHAKCIWFCGTKGGKEYTWVFIGSANASRRALMKKNANVEAGVLWKIPGTVEAHKLSQHTVRCPREQLNFKPRKPIVHRPNLSLMVKAATYHALERELIIEWNKALTGNRGIKVAYIGNPLFEGTDPPMKSSFRDFQLIPGCCELELSIDDEVFAVPISVVDPEALPDDVIYHASSLDELLALYGGRVSREKLAQVREREIDHPERIVTLLASLFGEHFEPVDVFRAWFGLRAEIESPGLTIGGLKVLIKGARGADVLVHLLDEAGGSGELTREEVWFYKLELYRTLSQIEFPEGVAFTEDKTGILDSFRAGLRKSIADSPPATSLIVERRLRGFYLK